MRSAAPVLVAALMLAACGAETEPVASTETASGDTTVSSSPAGAPESPTADASAEGEPDSSAGDATYETVLGGFVPANITPQDDEGPEASGYMKDGLFTGFEPDNPGAMVFIKDPADSSLGAEDWKRESVRFVDVAGDSRKEAIALLTRTRGGVPWSDGIVVYEADGGVVWSWSTDEAGGDTRGGTEFVGAGANSVDVRIHGTDPSSGGARQIGHSTYRLAKGADGNGTWQLVDRTW